MSDDTNKSGGQDRKRINVNQDYELRDWAKSLNTTPERVKEKLWATAQTRCATTWGSTGASDSGRFEGDQSVTGGPASCPSVVRRKMAKVPLALDTSTSPW